jgi:single-stranded DNA-binding protein
MKNIAEFQIIGRVGSIKTVGSTLRVSVCANYPVKDEAGEWKDHPHWNELTIFQESMQGHVKKHIENGDLVFARGRIKQNSYEKDGSTRYTVDLICTDFSRLARPSADEE